MVAGNKVIPPLEYDLDVFKALLKDHQKAYDTYMNFSPSIQKSYALSYFILKNLNLD